MYLSAMLTSLPLAFASAARLARGLGFGRVDVVGVTERGAEDADALADTGLLVSCAAIGRGLPAGLSLDGAALDRRKAALDAMQRQVADAAQLGATHCYVVPGSDLGTPALHRFADACGHLADYAAGRMVRLCVEHVPGRALPTVAATLAWLEGVAHSNISLLLDVGHCLISDEDPCVAVERAGERLGYVHLDDNDSVSDLHWPLLTGRLTCAMLEAFLAALPEEGYDGAVALELNPQNADPVQALRHGKQMVERLARNALST
jgi:sugar phosphate isomerase/epimerase